MSEKKVTLPDGNHMNLKVTNDKITLELPNTKSLKMEDINTAKLESFCGKCHGVLSGAGSFAS